MFNWLRRWKAAHAPREKEAPSKTDERFNRFNGSWTVSPTGRYRAETPIPTIQNVPPPRNDDYGPSPVTTLLEMALLEKMLDSGSTTQQESAPTYEGKGGESDGAGASGTWEPAVAAAEAEQSTTDFSSSSDCSSSDSSSGSDFSSSGE